MDDIKNIAASIFNSTHDKIRIQKCSTGDVNSNYIAEYDTRKIFIKVENTVNLPDFYSGQIEREVVGIRLCVNAGIPCPNILFYDLTGTKFSKKFIAADFIEYPMLSKVWNTLDTVNKQSLKKQALDIIVNLSEFTSGMFGDTFENGGIGRFKSWPEAFLRLVQVALNDCGRLLTLDRAEMNVVFQAANECSSVLPDKDIPCLCHMDLHWNNIFVKKMGDKYEIGGIIDFGSSLYAPEYSDLFRLQDGFLYGTEKFYEEIDKPYSINKDQEYAADLLNKLDYYVFLSYTGQETEKVKKRILDKCNRYLARQ